MSVIVHRNTRFLYRAWPRSIKKIAASVIPVIEEVTGLPMPLSPTITVSSQKVWHSRKDDLDRDRLASEVQELSPDEDAIQMAHHQMESTQQFRRANWAHIYAETINDGEGWSEIIIPGLSFLALGHDQKGILLQRTVTHELVHVAQHKASSAGLSGTFFPGLRGTDKQAISMLGEGHATWAERIVTKKIGVTKKQQKLEEKRLKSGWVQRNHAKFIGNTPDTRMMDSRYESAERFITPVIDKYGIKAFNEIWSRLDQLPPVETMGDIQAWGKALD